MRAVLQRVKQAKVTVDGDTVGEIGPGILALVGVAKGDEEAKTATLAKKIAQIRIFADEAGKMNRSLLDAGGACLVVSQFTLLADLGRGRRPYFGEAEAPERATVMCDQIVRELQNLGVSVQTGQFGAMMDVSLVNDGPVTIVVDL